MVRESGIEHTGGDRGLVVESLLCASRVSHAAIGLFSPSRLAVVDAEVASTSAVQGQAEALLAISRTFALHQFTRREAEAHTEGDRQALWLSSDRCLIGIRRAREDLAVFVALIRPPAAQEFPRWQRDIAHVALLYEHGRNEWSRAPAEPGESGAPIGQIMARLEVACALVDAGRNLIYANRAAGDWLRRQSVLRVAEGRLCASGCERHRRLAAAVQEATIAEPRRAQALVFREVGSESTGVVTCLPLPGETQRALVLFGSRGHCGELAELLLGAFGLTGAERRLACRLLAGQTLEQACEDTGIRVSTARGYLKAIFAKTGVRRQAEFVAVIGALVPPVLLPQAAPPLDGAFG